MDISCHVRVVVRGVAAGLLRVLLFLPRQPRPLNGPIYLPALHFSRDVVDTLREKFPNCDVLLIATVAEFYHGRVVSIYRYLYGLARGAVGSCFLRNDPDHLAACSPASIRVGDHSSSVSGFEKRDDLAILEVGFKRPNEMAISGTKEVRVFR